MSRNGLAGSSLGACCVALENRAASSHRYRSSNIFQGDAANIIAYDLPLTKTAILAKCVLDLLGVADSNVGRPVRIHCFPGLSKFAFIKEVKLRKPSQLSEAVNRRLREEARSAVRRLHPLKTARARYGAAVLTLKGNVFPGENWFSSSQSLSLHAEQVALAHAAIHREPLIQAIAIASNDLSTPPLPCGLCRQLLYENARHSKLDIVVMSVPWRGRVKRYSLSSLYPLPWPERKPRRRWNGR